MQILEESEKATSEALRILEVGGVVAHATETCYGLACDMTNSEAIEKLFKIKNRPPDQPVSALFPSIEASKEWVEWSDEALELAEKELPGPLTIILPIKENKFNKIFPVPSTALLRYCANVQNYQQRLQRRRFPSHRNSQPLQILLQRRTGD